MSPYNFTVGAARGVSSMWVMILAGAGFARLCECDNVCVCGNAGVCGNACVCGVLVESQALSPATAAVRDASLLATVFSREESVSLEAHRCIFYILPTY